MLFSIKKFCQGRTLRSIFCDDIIKATEPGFKQLTEVFKTCGGNPVLALKAMPEDRLSSYGVVEVEKIAHSFYKIKRIVEKPKNGTAPSNLAVLGRMIITPDVFLTWKLIKIFLIKTFPLFPF